MKSFIRATFCTISFAALATASSALGAAAQTADVPFSGTVAESCTFSNIVAGTLGLSGDGTDLGTAETGGVQGTVDLSCNGDATISVAAPTFTSSASGGNDITTFTAYAATSTVTEGANTADSAGATFVFGAANTITAATTFNVAMAATTDDVLPTDTYNFTVTVTATP